MSYGEPTVERADVEAVLEARRELGPSYEPALVDSFAERIEHAVAARMAAEVEERRRSHRREDARDAKRLALGVVSLGSGIPITAIAGNAADPGLAGIVVAWAGIVGVNVAYALRGRRDP